MVKHFCSNAALSNCILSVVLAVLIVGSARAFAQAAPSAQPDRLRIGLVLSGGGARGAAHVGVLKVLEELRVPIDAIAGTSMGAIIGGAYASGMSVEEMQSRIVSIRTAEILRDDPPRSEQSVRRKRDEQTNFLGPELGVRDGQLHFPKGAVSGVGLEAILRGLVRRGADPAFDALPIPFRAIATDIESGQMHVLASGSLASALRASMSIPGLFAPAELEGRLLVDGGLTRNLPVDVARRMGVDIVIAVNLGTPLLRRDQVTSVFGVTAQMINILTEQNVRASLASLSTRDVLISPDLGEFTAGDFDRMADVVSRGEAAAREATGALARLALPAGDYALHRARQRAAFTSPARPIDEIRFSGLNRVNPQVLHSLLDTQTGRPVDEAVLDADLGRIYGRGDFDRVGYSIADEAGKRVLLIEAQEKASGPNYLRFGLGLANDFAGNAHFQTLTSYRRTWINPLGAEWRSDLRLGRINQLTSEFYQPLDVTQSFFVVPYADIEQRPFDVFDRRSRIARFSRLSGSVGLDLGAQRSRFGEVRLGVFRGQRSFTLDTGPSTLLRADDAIDIGGARLRTRIDQLDSARFPRSGEALTLDVIASNPVFGARDRYTRWDADYLAAFSRGDHTWQLGLRAGGAAGESRLPNYDLFQFGGLMQLSGYRTGQLLGQSLVFGRAVYANRILGAPLLKGLFGGFSLEAGRVNDPLVPGSPSGLLTAGSIFLATDTPLGPVYLGLGHARGGNNALYLYLGVP